MPLALAASRDMPLYPFGHGLSYTGFGYSNLLVTPGDVDSGASVEVSVDVDNTGQAPRILPSVLYLVRESSSSQMA
jgi:beta-glucosidase